MEGVGKKGGEGVWEDRVGEDVGRTGWGRVWERTGWGWCGEDRMGECLGWTEWKRMWGGQDGGGCGEDRAGEGVGRTGWVGVENIRILVHTHQWPVPHTFSSHVIAATILPILLFIRVHWASKFPTQLNLCLPLQTTDVLHRKPHPLILPCPSLAVGSQHDAPQGIVMNEPLHLGLHTPVLELDLEDMEAT